MQPHCYQYLISRPDLAHFVRLNPSWYRYLTREPHRMHELPKEADIFYGRTFGQKVERLNDQVKMVNMIIQMMGAMKD